MLLFNLKPKIKIVKVLLTFIANLISWRLQLLFFNTKHKWFRLTMKFKNLTISSESDNQTFKWSF